MSWLNDRLNSLSLERRKYIISQLANHLAESGQQERLRQLLTSLDYLLVKILFFKTASLIRDLNLPDSIKLKRISQFDPYSSFSLKPSLENEAIFYLDKILLQNQHLLDRCESLNDIASTLLCHSSFAPSLYKVLSSQELPKPIFLPLHPLSDNSPPALICTLEGHTQKINSCAITANGSLAISASDDNTIKIWDTDSGVEIRTLSGHTKEVKFCGIDALGSKAVSTALDGSLRVWDIQKGITILNKDGVIPGAPCAISADGTVIATIMKARSPKKQNLNIWDIKSDALLLTISQPHKQRITSCALSSDGTIIVTTSLDGTVAVWDGKTGKRIRLYKHRRFGKSPVQHCAITANGESIISVGNDQKIHLWENLDGYSPDDNLTKTTSELHQRVTNIWGFKDKLSGEKQDATIYSYGMSYDGNTQAFPVKYTAEWAKSLGIEKSNFTNVNQQYALVVAQNDEFKIISSGHVDDITDCKVSGDGSTVISASSDCVIKVWNVRRVFLDKTTEYPVPQYVGSLALSDTNRIITGSTNTGVITVWDLKTNKPLYNIPAVDFVGAFGNGSIDDCTIDGSGARIVALARHRSSEFPSLRIWSYQKNVFRFWNTKDLGAKYNCCELSSSGYYFVAGAENGELMLSPVSDFWNGAGQTPIKVDAHSAAINDCVIDPKQSMIISASSDKTIKIWDFDTLSLRSTLVGHNDKVVICNINADGSKIISASADYKLILWDLKERKHIIFNGHKSPIVGCSISPDGSYIVSAAKDQSISIWNSGTGKRLVTLYLDDKRLSSCAYSSDGKSIVAGGYWGIYLLQFVDDVVDFPVQKKGSVDVDRMGNDAFNESVVSHSGSQKLIEKPLLNFIDIDDHKRTHFSWTSIPKAVEYIIYQDYDPFFMLPMTKQRLDGNTTKWTFFSAPDYETKKYFYCIEVVTEKRTSIWSNVLSVTVNNDGEVSVNSYNPPSGWRAKLLIAGYLELIPGIFGFGGIGWLYSGKYGIGIALLLLNMFLSCISLFIGLFAGINLFDNNLLYVFCSTIVLRLFIELFSYFRLWNYVRKKNPEIFLK